MKTENLTQQEIVASDGKLRKFMEENFTVLNDIGEPIKLHEDQIAFCCLLEMAYKSGKPRQMKMQSINGTEPQWVLSRFEKFKKPVVDKITTQKLSEIRNDDPILIKTIYDYCEKLQSEGAMGFMTEGNTGSVVMEHPPYAEGYYAHFID